MKRIFYTEDTLPSLFLFFICLSMARHFFSTIGKQARALLYKNYEENVNVSISSSKTTDNGTELKTSVARNFCTGSAEIHGQMKGYGIIYDLKANNSDINHTVTIGDFYSPEYNAVLHFSPADLQANKYLGGIAGGIAGVSLSSWFNLYPVVKVSSVFGYKNLGFGTNNLVFGTNNLGFGVDASLDTATWDFNCKVGGNLGVTRTKFDTSFAIWNITKDIISSSFYLKSSLYRCTIGGEMSYNMNIKNVTAGSFGLKFVPSTEIVCKARMVWMADYNWKVRALIKCKFVQFSTWDESPSYFTISAEFNPKSVGNKFKFGLALLIEA